MRGNRMNGFQGEFKSSFLSCEKDTESIIRKLFVDSKPHSDMLKRLLLINTPDCLNDMTNQVYIDKIKNTSIKDLREQGYIRLEPKIKLNENEEVKSYIVISFDNFVPNATNPEFRDCIVMIDVICHTDYWDVGNFRLRPLKIAGDIDGQGVCWSNVDFTDEYEKQCGEMVKEMDMEISDAAKIQDVGEDGIEIDGDEIERE